MNVNQVASLLNSVTSEILGENAITTEDLQNVVDIGKQIMDATSVDNYVKSLVNHIGKVIFVNRPYRANVPSVLMDSWEFGSVLEKIHADIPEASENDTYKLENGTSYDPNIFYKPTVHAKFFNSKVTFEVNISFAEKQVKESFSNAEQLNAFFSMLYDAVEKSITIKLDSLVLRTINSMTARTLYDAFGDTITETDLTNIDNTRAVNLLKRYNNTVGENERLTKENCLNSSDFLKFASKEISLYIDRLSSLSTLFNVGKNARFTPKEDLHLVMLSEFKASSETYLQADTFHDNLVKLPNSETVSYWQGSGENYEFADTSKIAIQLDNSSNVTASGILAVMFDRNALGVTNLDRRVTSNYNARAEFFTNFYKADAGYFNDLNENFVVFFVA